MFRAILLGLCVAALLVMPTVVQASAIPWLVDTTASATIADDSFEAPLGVPGSFPVAATGTWNSANTTLALVGATGEGGFAPYEGSQLLNVDKGGKVFLQGAATADGDLITLKMAFRPTFNLATNYAAFYPLNDFYSSPAICGEQGAVLLGDSGMGLVSYFDAGWHAMTQTFIPNEWNTLTITHTNNATDKYWISINGATPEGIPYLASWDGKPVKSANLSGIEWAFGNSTYNGPGTGLSLDSIPVPEPSTFSLLIAGLFGLSAYAWPKRK